jgi:hypothetical protein
MNLKDRTVSLIAIGIVLTVGLACKSLMSSVTDGNTQTNTSTASSNSVANARSADPDTKTADSTKVEKADFTMTSEDLDKEFTTKGVKDKDLEKYSNKNIAVTGRVTTLVTDKRGTTQPWVTLSAPGIGHGVNCYFDDENVGQMKKLKQDKNAKVQGFQSNFIVPEVSPMLKHCVVLEGSE